MFTYENSKHVKFATLKDAWEAIFCIRGLIISVDDRLNLENIKAMSPEEAALFHKITQATNDVWEAAREASNRLDDLIDLRAKQEA